MRFDVGVSFAIACLAQLALFDALGVSATIQQTLAIGGVLTVVSVCRSYVIRRFFEALRVRRSPKRLRSPVAATAVPGLLYRAPFKAL
jgi:hypothetical protein